MLVAVLLGLFVRHGTSADSHQRYPGNEEIATAYDDRVGRGGRTVDRSDFPPPDCLPR